jgi:hypothetical protein
VKDWQRWTKGDLARYTGAHSQALMKKLKMLLGIGLLAMAIDSLPAAEKLQALIIDGQNNHDWKRCTPILKWILEDSGRFTVEVSTTPPEKAGAPAWSQLRPSLAHYYVVGCN